MLGTSEIEALTKLPPTWWSLVIVAAVLIPIIMPLWRREREKPADPLAALTAAIRELRKDHDDLADDVKDMRRDVEKLERRQDLYQAIRDMKGHD